MKRRVICFFSIIICLFMLSCVKKSEYDAIFEERNNLEQKVQKYQNIIIQKDNNLKELQQQIDNTSNNSDVFNCNNTANENKGKSELEYVKSTLGSIIHKLNFCQNQDDLDMIIKNTKELEKHVDSYLFFNY